MHQAPLLAKTVLIQIRFFFFTGESNIMDRGYFSQKNSLKLKPLNDGIVYNKHASFHFSRCYLMDWIMWIACGLLYSFYQLFGLLFWRHPFTAEDPLLNKWCNANF